MFTQRIIPVPSSIPRGWALMAPMAASLQMERQLIYPQSMSLEDKREKAIEIVRNHVSIAMGAALLPIPGAGIVGVTGVQLNMLRQLAWLYDKSFMDALGKNVIFAVLGVGTARLGASMVNAIPGVGFLMGDLSMSLLSGASTYALGRVMANYFHQGGSLDNIDLGWARNRYFERWREGRRVASEIGKDIPVTEPVENEVFD